MFDLNLNNAAPQRPDGRESADDSFLLDSSTTSQYGGTTTEKPENMALTVRYRT